MSRILAGKKLVMLALAVKEIKDDFSTCISAIKLERPKLYQLIVEVKSFSLHQ
jgi:hypothetical protein